MIAMAGEKPGAVGLHVMFAKQIQERKDKENAKTGVSGIVGKTVAAIRLPLIFIRALRAKSYAVPDGLPNKFEITERQGDLPPGVMEKLMNNRRIDPGTLKLLKEL